MKKQRSPGPAAYNIKSTVCQDAPAYSFGTMKRPAPNFKGISPGPVYQLKASLGKNKDETFKAMPAFKFGTSERPDPAGNSRMRESPCEPHHSFFCVYLPGHAVSCALAAMLREHAHAACSSLCERSSREHRVRKRALLRNKMQQKAHVEKCASMYCMYTLLHRLTLAVIHPFPFLSLPSACRSSSRTRGICAWLGGGAREAANFQISLQLRVRHSIASARRPACAKAARERYS
jgi:hypothetical protein